MTSSLTIYSPPPMKEGTQSVIKESQLKNGGKEKIYHLRLTEQQIARCLVLYTISQERMFPTFSTGSMHPSEQSARVSYHFHPLLQHFYTPQVITPIQKSFDHAVEDSRAEGNFYNHLLQLLSQTEQTNISHLKFIGVRTTSDHFFKRLFDQTAILNQATIHECPPSTLIIDDAPLDKLKKEIQINLSDLSITPIVDEEDSIYRKLLSCIPLIGIFPDLINESSLKGKITEITNMKNENSNNRVVKLIKIKNDYKIASIIHDLLSVALIISTVAFSVFTIVVGGACAAFRAYHIYTNKQLINELEANKLTAGGNPSLIKRLK